MKPGRGGRRTGQADVRFGKTGKPVSMSQRKVDLAKKTGGRLYEDGTIGYGKTGDKGASARRPGKPPRR